MLEKWDGFLPWKDEKHLVVHLTTDSSEYRWAGVLKLLKKDIKFGDYWTGSIITSPIVVKEAKAVFNCICAIKEYITDTRIDIDCDCKSFIAAWEGQCSRSKELNVILKDIFEMVRDLRVVIRFNYVPSKDNLADGFSRILSKEDAMLSSIAWERIQQAIGGSGHTLDLMALDSNTMCDREGKKLTHFTAYNTPCSGGVNMFAQHIRELEICYVFPPFGKIASVLRFIEQQNLSCTIIVPEFQPKSIWLPKLRIKSSVSFLIGNKSEKNIILYPSKKRGYFRDKKGLPWDLFCYHICNENCVGTHKTFLPRHLYESGVSKVVVGDSIIKQMVDEVDRTCRVFAFGGATIKTIASRISAICSEYKPLYLFVHVGINDISNSCNGGFKVNVVQSIAYLCHILKKLENVTIFISAVVVSSLTGRKMGIGVVNDEYRDLCRKNNWRFIEHNILEKHLRDGLHLERAGIRILCDNLGLLSS
ncbi:hypothetical protein SNE40_019969 [Patella caerulea]